MAHLNMLPLAACCLCFLPSDEQERVANGSLAAVLVLVEKQRGGTVILNYTFSSCELIITTIATAVVSFFLLVLSSLKCAPRANGRGAGLASTLRRKVRVKSVNKMRQMALTFPPALKGHL